MHSNGSLVSETSPNALKVFFLASRPKTWSASICPVLIGAAVAMRNVPLTYSTLLLTFFFSLAIQIGTNYANDYFDFRKGSDTAERKGPKRAVQQGWVSPFSMAVATALAFTAAIMIAMPLMIATGPWSFGLGALCVLFGVIYTGGPMPLGYIGLGEFFVFIFFGPVACIGTYFLQTGEINFVIFLASLAPGFLSSALLMANNLRDEATDRTASKRTLVVRFGSNFGKWAYVLFLLGAFFVPICLKLFLAAFPFFFAPIKKVFRSQEVLQETSLLLVVYTIFFCVLVCFTAN